MPHATQRQLTNLDCIIQAEECRAFARIASSGEHRTVLTAMAASWERIADDLEARTRRSALRLV